MKARKEMTYEQLKTATIDAVKRHFVPQVDIIKKRIDSLVESDYLERSKEDRNVFHYVAWSYSTCASCSEIVVNIYKLIAVPKAD